METTLILRLSGLSSAVGGAGVVAVTLSHAEILGGCPAGGCPIVSIAGTVLGEAALGVTAVTLLVVAAMGVVAGARRRAPVGKVRLAAAVCAVGAAGFAGATAFTVARTLGESLWMPVFVFPALLLLTASAVLIGVVVLRAGLVPRRIAIAMIVAAALLPLVNEQSGNLSTVPLGVVCVVLGVHLIVRGGRSAIRLDERRPRAAGRRTR